METNTALETLVEKLAQKDHLLADARAETEVSQECMGRMERLYESEVEASLAGSKREMELLHERMQQLTVTHVLELAQRSAQDVSADFLSSFHSSEDLLATQNELEELRGELEAAREAAGTSRKEWESLEAYVVPALSKAATAAESAAIDAQRTRSEMMLQLEEKAGLIRDQSLLMVEALTAREALVKEKSFGETEKEIYNASIAEREMEYGEREEHMRQELLCLMERLDEALSATVDVSMVASEAAKEVQAQKENLQESERERARLEEQLEGALASSSRILDENCALSDELEAALVDKINAVGELQKALANVENLEKEVEQALHSAFEANEGLERSLVGSAVVSGELETALGYTIAVASVVHEVINETDPTVEELRLVQGELQDTKQNLLQTQTEARRLAHATIDLELDHISATEDVSATVEALRETQGECQNLQSQLDAATTEVSQLKRLLHEQESVRSSYETRLIQQQQAMTMGQLGDYCVQTGTMISHEKMSPGRQKRLEMEMARSSEAHRRQNWGYTSSPLVPSPPRATCSSSDLANRAVSLERRLSPPKR